MIFSGLVAWFSFGSGSGELPMDETPRAASCAAQDRSVARRLCAFTRGVTLLDRGSQGAVQRGTKLLVAPACAAARLGVASRVAMAGAALLSLAACGFRLAGSEQLPGVLARPYLSVKDPYTDFSREFEHQLKSSGALVQDVRAKSTATIEVTRDVVEQRTLSVSARNIPTEYELTYTVVFAVHGPDRELLAPQTINLSKDYSFVENELLAKENEADILRRQMARDLVAIAMRRLTSLK